MLNLAEILTIIIGLLLALVFIDGIRRSIRTRKNKLKVDLVQPSAPEAEESVDTFVPTNDETEFFGSVAKTDKKTLVKSENGPDDISCIFCTSGTTSRPKCVVYNHIAYWLNGLNTIDFQWYSSH